MVKNIECVCIKLIRLYQPLAILCIETHTVLMECTLKGQIFARARLLVAVVVVVVVVMVMVCGGVCVGICCVANVMPVMLVGLVCVLIVPI